MLLVEFEKVAKNMVFQQLHLGLLCKDIEADVLPALFTEILGRCIGQRREIVSLGVDPLKKLFEDLWVVFWQNHFAFTGFFECAAQCCFEERRRVTNNVAVDVESGLLSSNNDLHQSVIA